MIKWCCLYLCFLGLPGYGQIELTAPDSAPAGSQISITWTEGGDPKDFITIVPADTEEGQYNTYKYARVKSWNANVPEVVGEYEIRYLSAERPYPTLAKKSLKVTPVSATVSLAAEVNAGAKFEVTWTGPGNPRDFITIVEAGAPEKKYGRYVYTRKGSPLTLPAPDEPGDYEVRYLTGQKYFTLASAPLRVVSVTASLQAPARAEAGGTVEISWSGPDNFQDFITIVPEGAKEKEYGRYVYTRKGSPLTLRVPEEAGNYEIRYLTGNRHYTLASSPITIGAVDASVQTAASVTAGSDFEVRWTGPANNQDYITIVVPDAPEGSYTRYRYARKKNTVTLRAPEVPGDYQIRYVTGGKGYTLASTPVTVTPVSASLEAPDEVVGGERLPVKWEGPDNRQDFIAIAPLGSPDNEWPAYGYTHRGNPVEIRVPLDPGDYELRYLTGGKRFVLARRPLKITPPQLPPGQLRVLVEGTDAVVAESAGIELILDASGSMLQRLEGKRRIDIAKEVLIELVNHKLPAGTPMALRVFGHREADACRTDLEIPLAPLDPAKTTGMIEKIQAKNLAKTPIAQSLESVASDLSAVNGERIVVLITDGEETCGGDPAAAIQGLRDAGIDVRVNIVGFAIDDADLAASFRLWADLGGGGYFEANDAKGLGSSVNRALQIPFDVLDAEDRVVASGLAGGDAVTIPAGSYRIRAREQSARTVEDITVESGKEKTVTLRR